MPSTALRNSQEITNALIKHHGSEEAILPVLFMSTDGDSKYRTNFLSVKIAIIALQKFLDLDQIIVARTAPGHSSRNLAEKINCILNLGFYGIGCMQQRSSNAEFEFEIAKCDTLSKQRNLVKKNSENEALFAETRAPCTNLIKQNFEQLSLKDKKFICLDPASSRDMTNFLIH